MEGENSSSSSSLSDLISRFSKHRQPNCVAVCDDTATGPRLFRLFLICLGSVSLICLNDTDHHFEMEQRRAWSECGVGLTFVSGWTCRVWCSVLIDQSVFLGVLEISKSGG